MPPPLVSRDKLLLWGFIRLPDVWRYCHTRHAFDYFESWYHPEWNYTAILGLERCPLTESEDEFLARCQQYWLDQSEIAGDEPWPGGGDDKVTR